MRLKWKKIMAADHLRDDIIIPEHHIGLEICS
jgi:hypothetical protein